MALQAFQPLAWLSSQQEQPHSGSLHCHHLLHQPANCVRPVLCVIQNQQQGLIHLQRLPPQLSVLLELVFVQKTGSPFELFHTAAELNCQPSLAHTARAVTQLHEQPFATDTPVLEFLELPLSHMELNHAQIGPEQSTRRHP